MSRFLLYFKFLLRSRNEHSVHSPFVFQLVTEALYESKIEKDKWDTYLRIKKKLLSNKDSIQVNDYGAGSKSLKSDTRKISNIIKTAGISNKRARILFHLINYLQPNSILELGTSLGLSTSIMAIAKPSSKITTIEGCKNTLYHANESFIDNKITNIKSILGTFDDVLSTILKKDSFDLIFVDGNHSKEATIRYFEMLLDSTHNDTCIIFDDIYWSSGMKEAWNYIIKHPKVKVSIDTYQWGIVFFRKEQQKEHFTIRV